jgi:outer membrane lipoprotein-sorting protein
MDMMARLTTLILALLLVAEVMAQTPEQRGMEIALETERRDSGFEDYVVDGQMILKSASDATGERRFTMYTLETRDDGDKRLVTFHEPKDLNGMISLTYSHGLQPDDQWIYLPALRRTKRLAARDKTGSFAGSEFAFEDIGTWEVKKYSYRYQRDEVLDGNKTFVVENTPAYPYSGYSKIMEWVDQEIYHPRRLLYYDLELRFYDYRQYADRYWRPQRAVMTNLQTGAVSTIEWSDYRFRTGLEEAALRPNLIRRWSQ